MLDFPALNEYVAIATSALEMGVLLSVADENLSDFERNVSQLKVHYSMSSTTSDPTKKCHILGLNLMHLLVENKLAEFHAELEILSPEEAATSFISFPINLERQLMVGSYDEVINAGVHIPDPSYTLFMESLLETVRESIADCMEVSYKTMKLDDAHKMMNLDKDLTVNAYAEMLREDWIINSDELCFQPNEIGFKASDIPNERMIQQNLGYATELERIV